ncbi:MAG: hypothetical protein AAGM67_22140, partial [Bacteroidota bacterium]
LQEVVNTIEEDGEREVFKACSLNIGAKNKLRQITRFLREKTSSDRPLSPSMAKSHQEREEFSTQSTLIDSKSGEFSPQASASEEKQKESSFTNQSSSSPSRDIVNQSGKLIHDNFFGS